MTQEEMDLAEQEEDHYQYNRRQMVRRQNKNANLEEGVEDEDRENS